MFKLSVCAIVKNEAPYLAEWIEFHLLQGVEHFFLYENQSTDSTLEVIQRYKKYGLVTHIDWKEFPPQFKAYQHCLENFREASEWIAFIDVDEFLYSPTVRNLPRAISQAVRRTSKQVAGIAAHWMLFGSNRHRVKTEGLVVERFTARARGVNHHVKSIVRPKVTVAVGKNPHYFTFKPGFIAINETGKEYAGEYGITENGVANIFRVAHFHTKSYQEYIQRKTSCCDPGHGRFIPPEKLEEVFRHHDVGDSIDLSLRTYATAIKKALAKR